jgi:hypothetical protein
MKIKILLVCTCFFLIYCKTERNEREEMNIILTKSTNMYKKNISLEDSLALQDAKSKVLKFKNVDYFSVLAFQFSKNRKPVHEVLPYAFYLESESNSDVLYKTIFDGIINLSLKDIRPSTLNSLEDYHLVNENDFALALRYLKRGADLNYYYCLLELERIYRTGSGVVKDVKIADFYKGKADLVKPIYEIENIVVD